MSKKIDRSKLKEAIVLIDNEAFELLKNKKVMYNSYEYTNVKMEFIEENPKIEFNLNKINREEFIIKPNIDVFKIAILKGKNYIVSKIEYYIFYKNKVYYILQVIISK